MMKFAFTNAPTSHDSFAGEDCNTLDEPIEDTDEMYKCDNCGNVWDGNAQCLCGMGMASENDSDDDSEGDHDDADIASVSSDASDMLAEFEETGHIQNETTRKSIQQMLVVARSQENTDEAPGWMDETLDYTTKGEFVDGQYHIAAHLASSIDAVPPIKRMMSQICPMLTEEELDQFPLLLKRGMIIDDIIDGFNIKRLRDYETTRVNQLHWPHWTADTPLPHLELVKIIANDI